MGVAGAGLILLLTVVAWTTLAGIDGLACSPEADCPTLQELKDGAPLPQALRIYDRDGRLIARGSGPRRHSVSLDRIPNDLAEAFIAVEDHRFWSHGGIDGLGVIRAAARNVVARSISEGASTIPMQLVRTVWKSGLDDGGPWRRKLIEAIQAPRLIDALGHERVLNLYLNAIYLGEGVFGVQEASRHWFGVDVEDLSLGQMATLVGMTRSPGYYDPRRHPRRTRRIRNVVLDVMVARSVVDSSRAAEAAAGPLRVSPPDSSYGEDLVDRHVAAAVLRRLHRLEPGSVVRRAVEVHTTLDLRTQRAARSAVDAHIAAVEAGRSGDFLPGDTTSEVLEAAAVALDPETSEVLAWIGGRDFARSQFDRVEQAQRPVASLVKPFLVALALERGYGILDMVPVEGDAIATDRGPWLPADHVRRPMLPLREALVLSSNRAAARLALELGLGEVSAFGSRAGLGRDLAPVPSTAIGTFDASLLQITAAYAAFGNGGVRRPPRLIERVDGWDGRALWDHVETDGLRVMRESTAFVVLDAMRAVVDRGTGWPVREHGYFGPTAGKTGTSDGTRDAWFVGMTPDVVAGVWLGFDMPRTIVRDGNGGTLAAPIWADWMKRFEGEDAPSRAWSPPLTVKRIAYDPAFGDMFRADCPMATAEPYRRSWVGRNGDGTTRCPGQGIRRWVDRVRRTVIPGSFDPVLRDEEGTVAPGPSGRRR